MATQLEDFVYGQWGKKVDFYEFAGSPPAGLQPSKEAFGYDTINNKWYQWNKTEWNDLGSGGGLTPVVKNTSFAASVNTLYLVDCSSSAITISLPSTTSLVAGDIIEVIDIKGNSTVNNITLDFITVTQKLEGEDNNFILDDNGSYFRFIWSGDSAIGWKIVPEGLVGSGSSTSSSNIMSFPYAEDINAGTVVELTNDAGTAKVQKITRLNSTPTQILSSGSQGGAVDNHASYPRHGIIPMGGNYVVQAYHKPTTYEIYVRLGTVVGTTITWHSETSVYQTSTLLDIFPIDSTRFAVAYGSPTTSVKIGTISGTTITMSQAIALNYTGTLAYKIGLITTDRLFVGSHTNTSIYYSILDISGENPTQIAYSTVGISPTYSGTTLLHFALSGYGNGEFLYTTYPNGSGYIGHITVSGTTVTNRGGTSFSSDNYISSASVAVNTYQSIVATFNSSGVPKVHLISYSGTNAATITYTYNLTTFSNTTCDQISIGLLANGYALVVGKSGNVNTTLWVVRYDTGSILTATNLGEVMSGLASSSGQSFGKTLVTFPSTNICVVSGYKSTPSSVVESKAIQIGGLIVNHLNAIGICQETKTAGQSGNVALLGAISSVHNGLTPATNYYISSTGDIATTQTPYLLGRSLSSTQMLLTRGMY